MGISADSRRKKSAAAKSRRAQALTFYEFFAGGGMARAGLGDHWSCRFANDFDPKKAATYALNWGDDHLHVGDVARVRSTDLPGQADLVWASFPCQDLSLAGAGAGLRGKRSGTFWPFWKLVEALAQEGRAPPVVLLENVVGALTSHDGADFAAIADAVVASGYRLGAVVADAVHFVPQSRPRLFIIAVLDAIDVPLDVLSDGPHPDWHTPALLGAYAKLKAATRKNWLWWNLPRPPPRNSAFIDLVEGEPMGVKWHTSAETKKLIGMMTTINADKLRAARASGQRAVGAVYKRTRPDKAGVKRQRAEVRFDNIAGCLRTPAGGSSRQTIIVVDGKTTRSRLLSPREGARLMGLPDDYKLPANYNEAYHLVGDGVAVPVVRFLAANLIEPILETARTVRRQAA